MKKGRIFGAIIYFLFTFVIGIIFAITLPGYFVAFSMPANYVSEALQKGDYQSAMVLSGDAFNKEYVYQSRFDNGGGIVLFETVMQYTPPATDSDSTESSENEMLNGELYKTYMGYMYGIEESYNVFATSANLTKLIVTDLDGRETVIPILDYDYDGSGTLDGISSLEQNDFISLDISANQVKSIKKLSFVDRNGDVFFETGDLSALKLDYTGEFFDNFESIPQYNGLVRRLTNSSDPEEQQKLERQLSRLFASMTDAVKQDSRFVVMSTDCEEYTAVRSELTKRANKKAIPIIVAYFVCVYVIADFLLGTHYIIKFVRFILVKVFKVKFKTKTAKKSEVFGHDYFSQVTLSLDISELDDFNESVQIKYTNSDSEVVFILLKENNYTATERIKAGVYVNPFVDMNRDYATVNLPENLEVEGYKVDIKIRIIRREV